MDTTDATAILQPDWPEPPVSKKTKPILIYGLLDCVGTVRYVGKTGQALGARLYQHRLRSLWVRGAIVLEVVPAGEDWQEYERKHIAEQRDLLGDLLENRSPGGECWPSECSQETRDKLSAARMGKAMPPEWRANIAAARIAGMTPEIREKYAASKRGKKRKPFSPEWRAKLGAAAKGRVTSPETKEKLSISIAAAWTPERRAEQAERMRVMRRGAK